LDASLSLPIKFPTFCGGIPAEKSILLWGPPGTGKTMVAEAFAKGTGFQFKQIQAGNIMSAYYGETSHVIKDMFDKAIKTNTVLFIDELDAFGQQRKQRDDSFMRQIVTQLLQSMQQFQNSKTKSFLIGCTNTVSELDPADFQV
jgi:SpoVK/Ycf46/Vps4 family AAA+-type ATPase